MSKRVYDSLAPLRGACDKVTVVYRGTTVSEADEKLLRQALALRAAMIYDIIPENYQASVNQYYWSLCSLKDRTIDAYDLGKDIKALGLALRLYLERYENGSRDSRRVFLKRIALNYTGILLSPVYTVLDDYLSNPTVQAYEVIINFVDVLSKLNFTSINIEDLMVADYDAQESQMANWRYDPFIINRLNAIVTDWFRGFKPDLKAKCHHGGGASAEIGRLERGSLNKNSYLTMSSTLERLAVKWGMASDELPSYSRISEENRCSELQFVPKSMITNRVISKEPVALMWLQQGLKENIYGYFRRHSFLRKIINLQDQSLSAEMARLGSKTGQYATIDLSAASDSVSLELVGRLFCDTALYLPLLQTRSTHTVYRNEKTHVHKQWKLRKFAPMGSALCFPIECVVFASICELARRMTGSHKLFRVYGDDLVVPTDYADTVYELLEACHFTVNVRKSYKDTRELMFREACGGEYFNNEDVTPIRLSRALKAMTTNPSGSEFSSWVGLINRLTLANFRHAASYTLRCARVHWSDWSLYDCIEFSNDADRGLFVLGPCVDRRTFKYDRSSTHDYQRFIPWTTHIVSKVDATDKSHIDESLTNRGFDPERIRYEAWLYDAKYHPKSFNDDIAVLHLPDYVRPDAKSAAEYYPCRDRLIVTPLAS